ncbi:MAG TPA: hypothetical protein VH724_18605 [Candidatus Angelobacter sp.]|jgi:hypothetical protein|nr:hypothetical protein [Candidatus Angelobacter sp.]
MKLERDVIVDLLPAYFSGEASAATRVLVEDYFRQDPDFEKFARGAAGPLETLKVPTMAPDPAKEKLALERARMVTETRSSFLWLAVINTLMLFIFKIQNGKLVWILWTNSGAAGMLFAATAVFLWILFLFTRKRTDPLPAHTKFLWMASFYSLLLFLFRIENHKIVWLFFRNDTNGGYIFAFFALGLWAIYFYQRWKFKQTES